MHSCTDITERVTHYIDGAMGWGERMMFRFHLFACPQCQAYYEQMLATIETLTQLPPEPVPAETGTEMLAMFRNWKGGADLPMEPRDDDA